MPASRSAPLLTLIVVLLLGAAGATDVPLGAWRGTADAAERVLLEADRAVRATAADDEPRFWRLAHEPDFGDVLVLERNAQPVAVPFSVDGDTLTLDWGDDGGRVTYQPVADAPDALTIEPLDLPPTSTRLDFDVIDPIADELARRRAEDQRVRRPGSYDTPEGMTAMARVDRDNTAWLRDTITDVGWIDAARFGREAARAAFLLVQHSGDLELMVTALPAIEADVELGLLDGGGYALLDDRLALSLGRRQRHGSQVISLNGDPTTYVQPLEDREAVDARRAALGMSPLDEYLALFGDEIVFYDDVAAERARAAVAER